MSALSVTTPPVRLPDPPVTLPERLRLAPGRAALWRSPTCLQIGLNPRHAVVVEQLPGPLAELLKQMDGVRRTPELIDQAVRAGMARHEAAAVLTDLYRHGLIQEAAATDSAPPSWHRISLATETDSWSAHIAGSLADVPRHWRGAAVRVVGCGRVAVAVATALAAAGVGQVAVQASGNVHAGDVGTGYRPEDLGRPRAAAAADAVRRSAPGVLVETPRRPDLVVLSDLAVADPELVTELLADRIPHLLSYAHEGTAMVGPLVWPGRSSCLRCAELHRADLDQAWPKLAAQLVGQPLVAGLACSQLAAALTVQQVLAALAGPGVGLPVPATWGAALELDPVRATLRRHPRPPHRRCGCGAG